jgi:ABC-type thiamine transport system substrate-binding protein
VPTAEQIATLDPQTIAQNRERWLREWTQAVVR